MMETVDIKRFKKPFKIAKRYIVAGFMLLGVVVSSIIFSIKKYKELKR